MSNDKIKAVHAKKEESGLSTVELLVLRNIIRQIKADLFNCLIVSKEDIDNDIWSSLIEKKYIEIEIDNEGDETIHVVFVGDRFHEVFGKE